jgi:hypothetical protein
MLLNQLFIWWQTKGLMLPEMLLIEGTFLYFQKK